MKSSIYLLTLCGKFYHHAIKSEVGHHLKDWHIQVVVIQGKCQREDLFVILRKKDRATKSVPYPQCHRWMGTLGLWYL